MPDKDEFSQSKRQMMARIDVCMGGKVAEEVIFGRDFVTSGARSDLQQATSLARHMVTECGMSDELGKLALLLLDACFACHAAQHYKLCSHFMLGSVRRCANGSCSICYICCLLSNACSMCQSPSSVYIRFQPFCWKWYRNSFQSKKYSLNLTAMQKLAA